MVSKGSVTNIDKNHTGTREYNEIISNLNNWQTKWHWGRIRNEDTTIYIYNALKFNA